MEDEVPTGRRLGARSVLAAWRSMAARLTYLASIRNQAIDGPAIVARDLAHQRFGDCRRRPRQFQHRARRDLRLPWARTAANELTTMKMLTGCWRQRRRGADVRAHPLGRRRGAPARGLHVLFSLYNEHGAPERLDLHARLFHVPAAQAATRIARLMTRFDLPFKPTCGRAAIAAGPAPAPVAGGRGGA